MDVVELDELLSNIGNSYFESLTHPVTQDFEHSDWNTFVNDLTAACDSVFPRTLIRYTRVHALLLNWIDDDLNTDDELNDLDTTFKTQFNFTTEIWRIPSQEAEDKLETKLSEVKAEHGGQGKLLIVYYGGHGKWDPNNRSIWVANCSPESPKLIWSEFQPMLKRALCDVLILLDCCYAGSAGRDNISGTKELLAACGMEVEAEGVTNYSFTRNLIHKLQSFGSQPFTVSDLYERLLEAKKRLRNTPQYVPLSGRGRPSICITQLESATSTIPALSPVSSSFQNHSPLTTTASSTFVSTPASTMSSTGYRVLLAVSLKDELTIPRLDLWTKWLSSEGPQDIQKINVRIEQAFPSNSTLVLISMPASIWNRLPDTSAYRFVDFITGESHLKTAVLDTAIYDKEAKTKLTDRKLEGKQKPTSKKGEKLPGGKLVAPASLDKTVRLSASTGVSLYTLKGHSNEVNAAAFSPDGKLVASAFLDRTVRLWALTTGALLYTLEGHSGRVNAVAFSPDGKLVASASSDETVRLWDSATGASLYTLEGHSGRVNAIAFSPDGKLVASASSDETVRLWDSATGTSLYTLEGHLDRVNAIAFSPDGKLVVSTSLDKTVRLWDSATGASLQTLEGHENYINAVAFSLDGKLVASASDNETVRLWDSATGASLLTLKIDIAVRQLSFSSDGQHIDTDRGQLDISSLP